ncbi:MAG: pseudouridine synthase [Bacteroidetes bacterium GWF2_33_16]|nr:MAG: pseudouridine synthase [Bacteroidetes bacterium GWE2_32_14]OFY06097.1 MAG: pseudouridine synthase [Bacteroidetes bacterium GWF2_33_16]
MRYFFHIGYNGINYRGWQRQRKDVVTVQAVIEEKLRILFKKHITTLGCGRTDAKVHAMQYFFHIDIENEFNRDVLFLLNKMLPNDISIFDIIKMDGEPHAQYDAFERTYDYFIHTVKDPFLSDFSSLYLINDLNIDNMRKAVALLPKYDDYRALCKSPDKHNNTNSKVTSAKLFTNPAGDKIRFQITANKFLKAMVRIIVGKLIEIGTGELTVAEFENKLKSQIAPLTVKPAYPQGLYLTKVTYPFLDIPARTEWLDRLHNTSDNYWKQL